jgi:hypothetical protein
MRRATCHSGEFAVLGTKEGVRIAAGWSGDLDLVVGVNGDGSPLTLGDALGPHVATHFELDEPAAKKRPTKPATPASEE